ncbi:MAG TPA: sterol desaturase family protein [Vicinamibacteria bacterium]|nr:sterol desaturase family protein [Vicinamibacteria bacterium]
MALSKEIVEAPRSVDRGAEARKARRRLYPVSVVYSLYALTLLTVALGRRDRLAAIAFFLLGGAAWTALEYWVHRYILHGRFPDGPGALKHLLHVLFDHLHVEHHKRPWDGNHVNGTLKDTGPFVALLILASWAFPVATAPVFVAGLMQFYVLEEWVHHSVHFCNFKGHYFQYIKRHHLYHHSPRGSEVGYGLTSGFWDVVFGTRIAEGKRRALYSGLRT